MPIFIWSSPLCNATSFACCSALVRLVFSVAKPAVKALLPSANWPMPLFKESIPAVRVRPFVAKLESPLLNDALPVAVAAAPSFN